MALCVMIGPQSREEVCVCVTLGLSINHLAKELELIGQMFCKSRLLAPLPSLFSVHLVILFLISKFH